MDADGEATGRRATGGDAAAHNPLAHHDRTDGQERKPRLDPLTVCNMVC